MTAYLKFRTLTLIIAMTLALSAQSLHACASCGCAAGSKPTEKKKPAACCIAAKEAGVACAACAATKADKQACAAGVCSLSTAPKAGAETVGDHNISTFQMKALVDSGDAILLDARSGKYDDGYRIPGAKSLNSKSTAEEVAAVVPGKDAQITTYCSNLQCPASKALAEHLEKLGYTHVHEYPEGIAGWRTAGGKVDKAK